MLKLSLSVLVSLFAMSSFASIIETTLGEKSIENVKIAVKATTNIDGRKTDLLIAGAGLRVKKKAFIPIKVYVAQIFVSELQKFVRTEAEALNSLDMMNTAVVQLTFVRNVDAPTVQMSFKDVYPYEMRLMLTFVRNMYESTYSLQLKTAFLMKNIKEFKNLDFHQRLSIAVNSIHARGYGHSNYEISMEFSTIEDILGRYKKIVCKARSVNNFYKRIEINFDMFKHYMDNQSCLDLIDNKISDNIMEKLIYNYNLIKNE